MQKTLTIGFLAKAAGVNIETIRYYQRVGLIKEPKKPATGFRQYSAEAIDTVKFVKRAQKLGFSLAEISELLELGDGHCEDVRLRAEHKRHVIDQQITDLSALRNTLDELIQSCVSEGKTHCPIVATLLKPEADTD